MNNYKDIYDERNVYKSNFMNKNNNQIGSIRVTQIKNSINAWEDFQKLIRAQEWKYGKIVRMEMSDSQRHASDKDLTRIAFLQFANTMSNYAAIKEFHNAWHHGFKLRFQRASETKSEYNPKPFIQREYRAKDMVGVEFKHKNVNETFSLNFVLII